MKFRSSRKRGHLLIEFAVAAAVMTVGVATTMAATMATAKNGRQIRVVTQAISDASAFAEYSTNLHQVGGSNTYGLGGAGQPSDIATDYANFLNMFYPSTASQVGGGNISLTNVVPVGAGATSVGAGVLMVGFTGGAEGQQVPAAGLTLATFAWQGTESTNMRMILVYADAEASEGFGTARAFGQNVMQSKNAESVSLLVEEDPGTGVIRVSQPTFGTTDLTNFSIGVLSAAVFTPGGSALNSNGSENPTTGWTRF